MPAENYFEVKPRILSRMALLLAALALRSSAVSLRFGAPSTIGAGYNMVGFQSFGDGIALGYDENGWVGTVDGGQTWSPEFQGEPGTLRCTDWPPGGKGSDKDKCLHGNELQDNFTYVYNQGRGTPGAACGKKASCWCCRCPKGGPCTAPTNPWNFTGQVAASVLSTQGRSRHDFGSLSVPDKDAAYTSLASNTSTVFSVSSDLGKGSFTAVTEEKRVEFRGIPSPGASCGDSKHRFGCPFRLSGRGYVRLADGTLVMTVIIWWGGSHANPNPKLASASTSVVAFRSRDDGYSWEFSGIVLDASEAPQSEEGPNENDVVLLADGMTIMSIVRLDAGDGPLTRPYRPYVRILSFDGGRTWGNVSSLPEGVGCARPRLMRTDDGQIVLSGGRLNSTNRDTLVWLNSGRDLGETWRPYSVTYWHNLLEANETLHFTSSVNSSDYRQTMSYTSIVKTGAQSGFVTYARRLPDTPDVAFSIPFTVEPWQDE